MLGITAAMLIIASVAYLHHRSFVKDRVAFLKRELVKDFPDPESTRFRNIELRTPQSSLTYRLLRQYRLVWSYLRENKIDRAFSYDSELLELCGEVNAKNLLGAYTGYRHFYIAGAKSTFSSLGMRNAETFAKEMCAIHGTTLYSEKQ
jgi:hypothetical protein